jgi:hypothetical protein
MRMPRFAASALLAAAVSAGGSATAQTPGAPASRTGDGWDSAKTADYVSRYGDEVRARQAFDARRVSLRTKVYREALDHFDPAQQAPLPIVWGRFVTAGGASFVALHVALPPAAAVKPGAKVTVFGEIDDEKGTAITTFEEPLTVVESKGDLFVERTLFLPPGKATGTFGIASGPQVLALGRATVEIIGKEPSPRDLSDLIVSRDVHNLAQLQNPFEPFSFGGTKVVPKADLTFSRNDEVWLFTEFRDASLKDAVPQLSMRVTVDGNGKKTAGTWQPVEPSPLKGVPGHFGVGTTVDVATLKPGRYTVTLSVRDARTKESYERTRTIEIRE